MLYADVIVPVPVEGMLTYSVPAEMEGLVRCGSRVAVPIGEKRVYVGVVARLHHDKPCGITTKDIAEALDVRDGSPCPSVLETQMRLWRWIAGYYICPVGDVLHAALPAKLRKRATGRRKKSAADEREAPPTSSQKTLTPPQQKAMDEIVSSFKSHDTTLLHGVTSSGKTEIYIHLIERAMSAGRQTLYLLPSIASATQIADRLRRVFGSRVTVWHIHVTDSRQEEIWFRMLSDSPFDIIVGLRSAVFLPFRRLGLVIIDDEQDTGYKQTEPAPRYNGRDTATVLARLHGAKTLIGTATPSVETYFNATVGDKYGLVTLSERYGGAALPTVETADVKTLRHRREMKGLFSPQLLAHVRQALDDKAQVILFQNRRGYATMIECKHCGWKPRCPHCDVPLTYHKAAKKRTLRSPDAVTATDGLRCHYCGRVYPMPVSCPSCGNAPLTKRGTGTEKVEEQIKKAFPQARTARIDLDNTRTRDAYTNIITDFSEGRTDILVCTQQASNSLDFGGVSVVGVIDADAMMNAPNFRAYEQAFTTIMQIGGRAGRGGRPGTVVLQTRDPDAPPIRHMISRDYAAFYNDTIAERRAFRYPPFTRLVDIYVRHLHKPVAEAAAQTLGDTLRTLFGDRVLGPDMPAKAKVKGACTMKLTVKLETALDMTTAREKLRGAARELLRHAHFSSVRVFFDADPI